MVKKYEITPWKVEGEVDYAKLIKDFGTEPIDDVFLDRLKKHVGRMHYMLRRKIFFSHRDMDFALDKHEKGEKFYLYTGRGPSGQTHLGHLVPWMFTKWLQEKFGSDLWFQMTDDEKFMFNDKLTIEDTNALAYENALDVIAIGFKKGKTFIFSDVDFAKTLYRQAIRVAKN